MRVKASIFSFENKNMANLFKSFKFSYIILKFLIKFIVFFPTIYFNFFEEVEIKTLLPFFLFQIFRYFKKLKKRLRL